jgi:hypothetical protein
MVVVSPEEVRIAIETDICGRKRMGKRKIAYF